jgi:hypothetical protein
MFIVEEHLNVKHRTAIKVLWHFGQICIIFMNFSEELYGNKGLIWGQHDITPAS